MPYNREELAWSAGFFDGEGSVHTTFSWRTNDGRIKHAIQVSISQSTERGKEVLKRFNEAIGNMGRIYGPYSYHKVKGRSPSFQLEMSGFAKVQMLLVLLEPWLSSLKREKFIKILREHVEERKVR